jgi:hypothetical protein
MKIKFYGDYMKAYKLVRLKKDGSLGSLFIHRQDILPIGEWLEAEFYPTPTFSPRKGWHCTFKPVAPHLKTELKNGEKRIWVKVEVEDFTEYNRPDSQGGKWILANKMKILKILEKSV